MGTGADMGNNNSIQRGEKKKRLHCRAVFHRSIVFVSEPRKLERGGGSEPPVGVASEEPFEDPESVLGQQLLREQLAQLVTVPPPLPPPPPLHHSSRKRGTVARPSYRSRCTGIGFGNELRYGTIRWPVRVPGSQRPMVSSLCPAAPWETRHGRKKGRDEAEIAAAAGRRRHRGAIGFFTDLGRF